MPSIVFVDVETGGLDPQRHSLATIGLVTLGTSSGRLHQPVVLKLRDTPYRVEARALEINRVNLEKRQEVATEREHAANDLREYLQARSKKRVMVGGHNVSFDVRSLRLLLPSPASLVGRTCLGWRDGYQGHRPLPDARRGTATQAVYQAGRSGRSVRHSVPGP